MRLPEVVAQILSGLSTSPMGKAHNESGTGEVDLSQLEDIYPLSQC